MAQPSLVVRSGGPPPLISDPETVSLRVEVERLTSEVAALAAQLSLAERAVQWAGGSPAAHAVWRWRRHCELRKAHCTTARHLAAWEAQLREQADGLNDKAAEVSNELATVRADSAAALKDLSSELATAEERVKELTSQHSREQSEWQHEKQRLTALAASAQASALQAFRMRLQSDEEDAEPDAEDREAEAEGCCGVGIRGDDSGGGSGSGAGGGGGGGAGSGGSGGVAGDGGRSGGDGGRSGGDGGRSGDSGSYCDSHCGPTSGCGHACSSRDRSVPAAAVRSWTSADVEAVAELVSEAVQCAARHIGRDTLVGSRSGGDCSRGRGRGGESRGGVGSGAGGLSARRESTRMRGSTTRMPSRCRPSERGGGGSVASVSDRRCCGRAGACRGYDDVVSEDLAADSTCEEEDLDNEIEDPQETGEEEDDEDDEEDEDEDDGEVIGWDAEPLRPIATPTGPLAASPHILNAMRTPWGLERGASMLRAAHISGGGAASVAGPPTGTRRMRHGVVIGSGNGGVDRLRRSVAAPARSRNRRRMPTPSDQVIASRGNFAYRVVDPD